MTQGTTLARIAHTHVSFDDGLTLDCGVTLLIRAGANVSFVEIPSDKGHDAFLLDEPDFHRIVAGFLAGCAVHAKLAPL